MPKRTFRHQRFGHSKFITIRTSQQNVREQINRKILPSLVKKLVTISEKPRNPVSIIRVEFIWHPDIQWGDMIEIAVTERTEAHNGVKSEVKL